jgi:hypothetical protein
MFVVLDLILFLFQLIDCFTWICAWIFVSGALCFFIYWIFAWGVFNGQTVLANWGLNYSIGAIQDIFFVQIAKIYIVRYLGIEAAKPQLRNIYRVLNSLFMTQAVEGINISKVCTLVSYYFIVNFIELIFVGYSSGAVHLCHCSICSNVRDPRNGFSRHPATC